MQHFDLAVPCYLIFRCSCLKECLKLTFDKLSIFLNPYNASLTLLLFSKSDFNTDHVKGLSFSRILLTTFAAFLFFSLSLKFLVFMKYEFPLWLQITFIPNYTSTWSWSALNSQSIANIISTKCFIRIKDSLSQDFYQLMKSQIYIFLQERFAD